MTHYSHQGLKKRVAELEDVLAECIRTFETAHHRSDVLKRARTLLGIEPPWFVKQQERNNNG